jgi:hypothetical protein
MAIVKSHLFSVMAGSVGGITYLRNRYGSIVARSRTTPTDPNTPDQQSQRSKLSAGVAAWKALTPAERLSWEHYAKFTPWFNSLGDEIRLTGFNMYLSVRLTAQNINPTMNTSLLNTACCVPGLMIHPEVSFSGCSGGVAGFCVDLVNPHPTDNMRVGIQISPAQSTSVNFYVGPYDKSSYSSTASIPPGFGTSVCYKNLCAGMRYFLRIRCWNNTLKTIVSSPLYLHCDASACT